MIITADTMTHLSLFSGIGGIDLAAEAAGFVTVGQCEMDNYATKVLTKHWPDVPRWRDIHELTAESFYEKTGMRTVKLISGGFPCQPFSVAGKQTGKKDERYLWPEMLRVIRQLAPRWVVAENVSGILRIAGDDVCQGLEQAGYGVRVFHYEAAAVGAPHRRARVFFVGNTERGGQRGVARGRAGQITSDGCKDVPHADSGIGQSRRPEPERQQGTPGLADGGNDVADTNQRAGGSTDESVAGKTEQLEPRPNSPSQRGVVADANLQRRQEQRLRIANETKSVAELCGQNISDTDQPRLQVTGHESKFKTIYEKNGKQFGGSSNWWAVEPDVGRVAYGVSSRVDRLKCLGNAVVPQQVYPIFAAIAEIERKGVS